jgi:general secretion pathway protein A
MYENFYGFKEKPFHIVPNPKYLYLSPKHQNALTYLEYGLAEGVGFILLTGEIGTGKTTLIDLS